MGMLDELKEDKVWEDFLRYKTEKNHWSSKEQEVWETFVAERQYRCITSHLTEKCCSFDYPMKKYINKSGTAKKGVVYSFPEDQSMVLKVMAHLLYRYDGKLSPSCYSFRRSISARDAIREILQIPHLDTKYCVKVDISNYFNSIPVEQLVQVLRDIITDDPKLLAFLTGLLEAGKAYDREELVEEARGAMAGTPISPFFANIYLLSLDNLFTERQIPYFRYSDDILFFTDSCEEAEAALRLLQEHITEKGLSVNQDKLTITRPGEVWEFLGFCYRQGEIDLSEITKRKMKAKIKRRAHTLYRWRTKNNNSFERAAKAMIRTFNKKFYDEQDENRFTWSRWFFPILTTDEGLKELDSYMVQYIRYLSSGRHYKGNYRVSYEDVKELGYRSLVNEYYKKST